MQGVELRQELIQQALVQPFFPRQGALVGRQRLVLKGFQLRGDVALDVFQRLAAAVIGRHVVALRLRHLDVKTVHAVVFHLEIGDAAALAFAAFQIKQEVAAIGLNGAQLVQFGIKPVGNDAALAQHAGRFGAQGGLQQGGQGGGNLQFGAQAG